ncbi:MAG: hypothetical protein COB15_12995 [Flavobacteriales bacterium]|nr:MAG: hypothetical protein COB15_12995 [Flavobacteriales bacterium]
MDIQAIEQVVIADILGKVVYSEKGNEESNYSNTIDLSRHNKGIYFVRVQYENKLEVRKVVYQ